MPPPPEGFVSPMTWGVDTHIIERFGQAGVPKEKISMVKDTYHFISPDKSPAQFIDSFRRFYGPTMNAFEAAEKSGKEEELHSQLLELAKAQNRALTAALPYPPPSCESPFLSNMQARATSITLRCCTSAGLGERAVCSSGLRFRHGSPSPREYVRDEAG